MPTTEQQPKVPPPVPPKPPVPADAAEAAPSENRSLRVSLMLPDSDETSHDWRRTFMTLGVVILIEVVVIGAVFALVSRQVSAKRTDREAAVVKLQKLQKENEQAEKSMAEVAAYSLQLDATSKALDEHLYWTQVLDLLIHNARPGTFFVNFVGDAGKSIVTIDAIAPTYRQAAEQIVALRADPFISNVETTAASARLDDQGNVTGVAFSMTVSIKVEAFLLAKASAQAAAPAATGTSTTSVQPTPAPSTAQPAPLITPTAVTP